MSARPEKGRALGLLRYRCVPKAGALQETHVALALVRPRDRMRRHKNASHLVALRFRRSKLTRSEHKPASRSSRRRVEFAYLTFGYRISCTFKGYKHRRRCSAMLPATLTMTPIDPLRLASRRKTHRAAQTATFELVSCATHNLILPSCL